MYDFGTKIADNGATKEGRLSHGEDNVRFRELENAITSAGITLDDPLVGSTDEKMLAQAMGRYASGGVFATATGSANAITITETTDSFKLSKGGSALFDGLHVMFRPAATNTGACTLNYNGVGALPLTDEDGVALTGGELLTGLTMVMYHGGTSSFRLAPWSNSNNFNTSGGGGGGGSANLVYTYDDTPRTFSIADWTDTGIAVSITPSSTSSKIKLTVNTVVSLATGGATGTGYYYNHNFNAITRITRDGVVLTGAIGAATPGSNSESTSPTQSFYLIDEPVTTSPVVYKIQTRCFETGTYTVHVNSSYRGEPYCSSMVAEEF